MHGYEFTDTHGVPALLSHNCTWLSGGGPHFVTVLFLRINVYTAVWVSFGLTDGHSGASDDGPPGKSQQTAGLERGVVCGDDEFIYIAYNKSSFICIE